MKSKKLNNYHFFITLSEINKMIFNIGSSIFINILIMKYLIDNVTQQNFISKVIFLQSIKKFETNKEK